MSFSHRFTEGLGGEVEVVPEDMAPGRNERLRVPERCRGEEVVEDEVEGRVEMRDEERG